MKLLYAILQNYIDANELDEVETPQGNILEIAPAQPRVSTNPQDPPASAPADGHSWFIESREARDHDLNQPLQPNEAFVLDFKSTKYLQPIFKKLFDYLKCCKAQFYVRPIRTETVEPRHWDLYISYVRPEGPAAKEGVCVNGYRSSEDEAALKESLSQTLTFVPILVVNVDRFREMSDIFNREVRYLSTLAIINYLELCQTHPDQWREIISAYRTCTEGAAGPRNSLLLEYRDIFRYQHQAQPQFLFYLNLTVFYEGTVRMRRMLHLMADGRVRLSGSDRATEDCELLGLKDVFAKYVRGDLPMPAARGAAH